ISETQNSYNDFDEYMNYILSLHFENNSGFASLSIECGTNTLPVFGNGYKGVSGRERNDFENDNLPVFETAYKGISKDNIFEYNDFENEAKYDDFENEVVTGKIKNNKFEDNDSEDTTLSKFKKIYKGVVGDSEDESEDSPLKELYTEQTFTSFKLLEKSNTHSTQCVESMNRVIKLEANLENSLCQLQAGIKLRLKDEAKYARLQEFQNMNPTAGLSNITSTIFKSIDDMCKKTSLYSNELNNNMNKELNYDIDFIEDDYEEPQVLLNMALEDCSGRQEVNNQDAVKLDSKKAAYSRGLGLCKKALDVAIINSSNRSLEGLLQRFIDEQVSNQKNTQELSEQEFMISNPLQHKGKGRSSNKRCLLAIENHDTKNVCSNN
ncbi:13520_t:CDS:2, partial [Dentiscutata erythropus]